MTKTYGEIEVPKRTRGICAVKHHIGRHTWLGQLTENWSGTGMEGGSEAPNFRTA